MGALALSIAGSSRRLQVIGFEVVKELVKGQALLKLAISGKRAISRVSEGEIGVMVLNSCRMRLFFLKEGYVQLEKEEVIRAVRCERIVGEEILRMDLDEVRTSAVGIG